MQLGAKQKGFLELVAIVIAFYVLGWTGLYTSVIASSLGSSFLPCGLAVALLLVRGFYLWPVIWLAGFTRLLLVQFQDEGAVLPSLLSATLAGVTISTCAALLMAFLVGRFFGRARSFRSIEDVLVFVGVAAFCSGLAAFLGLASIAVLRHVPEAISWRHAIQLWLADFSSVLMLAPIALSFREPMRRQWNAKCFAEAGVLTGVLLLLCLAFFSPSQEPGPITSVFIFLLLPIHLWAALRFRILGLMLSILPVAVLSITKAAAEFGIFGAVPAQETLIIVHIYIGVISITGLTLIGALTERDLTEGVAKQQARQYHSIFENSALPLCEENWHEVKLFLDQLTADGVNDLDRYFDEHPQALSECLRKVRLIDANQAMIDLLKAASKDEVIADLAKFIAPESFGALKELLIDFAQGQTRFRGEEQMISSKGDRIYAVFDAICLPGSESSLERVIFSIFDFTESKINLLKREKAEGEALAAKEFAEKANRAKSLFLANMSHEIRTPVSVIMGYSEMLREGDISKDDTERAVTTIVRNGMHLLRLIDDILDLSKIEAGRLKFNCVRVALASFFDEVKASLQLIADAKGVGFTFVCHPPLPEVIVSDPTRCRQILFNLVDNAIKFTPPAGSVSLDVSLAPGVPQGAPQLYFVIRDTGCGIASDQQAQLFTQFSQGDPSSTRQHGGTGLGLVLARDLARHLGGDVWLQQSQVGVGSTFCCTIAISKPKERVTPQDCLTVSGSSVDKACRSANPFPLRNMRLLVAEDQPELQRLILLEDPLAFFRF